MQNAPEADADDMKGPREVLMIEDSATDAELALRAFKRAEFANPVRVVTSGEEGLDYLFGTGPRAQSGPTRPQMILLDLNLPAMSGIEFLRHIKGDERTRDIQVVVLSHSDRDRDVTVCVQLGAEAYLVKPLSFDNFVRVTTRLKLRMTLGSAPDARKIGGWILTSFRDGIRRQFASSLNPAPIMQFAVNE